MSDGLPGKPRAISPVPAGWLIGLLAAAMVLLAVGGESWQFALRYERDRVLAGELWRLVTAHLVHGAPHHLALNGAGLLLVARLFGRDLTIGAWLAAIGSSMAFIDAGFVFLKPQLEWYVGLSGVLHGVLAAGAVAWLRLESRPLALALGGILTGKLAWEQWQGALPLSGDMPVVVDGHLYGALGGALAGVLLWLRTRDCSGSR